MRRSVLRDEEESEIGDFALRGNMLKKGIII
jgi:hypothetical protein